MKKILFVIPTLRDGGAERSLVNLLTELPTNMYDIDLLLFKKQGIFLKQIPKNVHMLEQPPILKKLYGPISKSGMYMPIKVGGNVIAKIIKKGMGEQKAFVWEYFYKHVIDGLDKEYDVAIGYLGGESTYYILDKVKAKRRIHWVHNDYRTSGMPKKYDLKIFQRVDAIVTISNECLKILNEEFPQYSNKCFCIANITSATQIRKRANEFVPKEFDDKKNIFVSVGRLSEQKGFDMAITAARIMKERGLEFEWFVIGSGPLKNKLEEQIKKDNVEKNIFLLGTKSNPYPYINKCDIFVQPSRYEGKSVVLDEAKILGKTIVATKYPTVCDQIVDGKEGIVAEMSPEGIAEKIIELCVYREKREKLEDYLLKRNYGNQAEIKKYIDIIDNEEIGK